MTAQAINYNAKPSLTRKGLESIGYCDRLLCIHHEDDGTDNLAQIRCKSLVPV